MKDVPGLDRRSLLGVAVGAASSLGLAGRVGAQERKASRTMNLDARDHGAGVSGAHRTQNPMLFWNGVALQLVALDHSIDARDSRAPGPCATARALGLVHVVMADAVAAVYPVDFEGLYVKTKAHAKGFPDVFVAGAAAWTLEYIYGAPAHSQLIGWQRLRFLDSHDPAALPAWEAGLAFARNEAFTSRWDWPAIRAAVLATPTPYIPSPRGHNVDPFNADQGFYGVHWGRFPPLSPRLGDIVDLGPGDPPRVEDEEYQRDLEEVRRLGVYNPEGPTRHQRIGLFWAYDGARLIGTPPRLYNQIVRQIADDDGMSVQEMARLFALCNLAMADAGIVAWEAKYRYNVWRPVVAIRHSQYGSGGDWRPLGSPRTNPTQFALGKDTQARATAQNFLGASENGILPEPASRNLPYKLAAFTPNFPAYPSGHATFGSACFNILKKVRAEREPTRSAPSRLSGFTDFVSDELNGISIDNFKNEPRPYLPINYESIDQMIEHNNRSRVFLGVHWNFDCERGSDSGARIADSVYEGAYRRALRILSNAPAPQRSSRPTLRR
jgi:hypothetical protein